MSEIEVWAKRVLQNVKRWMILIGGKFSIQETGSAECAVTVCALKTGGCSVMNTVHTNKKSG